jgi:type IV pilus assembly protein PilA
MRNKKGFTLIELLAVLVVLAVIALIATPVVLSTLATARREGARSSAYGYVKAVEHSIAQALLVNPAAVIPTHVNATTGISTKGKVATSLSLTLTNGSVVSGVMVIDGYTATFANGSISTFTP